MSEENKYEIWARQDRANGLSPEISYRLTSGELRIASIMWSAYRMSHPPNPRPANHKWDWRNKAIAENDHSFVALKYAGKVQGLMMIALDPKPCRLKGFEDKKLLYVEYLETAPWNQKPYAGPHTEFLGVGSCLIDVAIDMSIDYRCEGRLGLHSLDDAKGFYIDQGFQNLGDDSEENLDYFELNDNAFGDKE